MVESSCWPEQCQESTKVSGVGDSLSCQHYPAVSLIQGFVQTETFEMPNTRAIGSFPSCRYRRIYVETNASNVDVKVPSIEQ